MPKKISPSERQKLADLADISAAYLYQCLAGYRDMDPVEARRVEAVTNKRLRLWDLCPTRWRQIWPELQKLKGAPELDIAKRSRSKPSKQKAEA